LAKITKEKKFSISILDQTSQMISKISEKQGCVIERTIVENIEASLESVLFEEARN
jgi:hypothetical protein